MKIRTDFVTNSSSSSFITIQIHTNKGKYTLEELPAYEYEECWSFAHDKPLEKALEANDLAELMQFLYGDEEEYVESILGTDLHMPLSDVGKVEIIYEREDYGESLGPDNSIFDLSFDFSDIDWGDVGYISFNETYVYDISGKKLTYRSSADIGGEGFDSGEKLVAQAFSLDESEFTNTDWVKGAIFVFTGLDYENEKRATKIVEQFGGTVKSSCVLDTRYLVYNPNYGSETTKMKRAAELIARGKNITRLTVEQFFENLKK